MATWSVLAYVWHLVECGSDSAQGPRVLTYCKALALPLEKPGVASHEHNCLFKPGGGHL